MKTNRRITKLGIVAAGALTLLVGVSAWAGQKLTGTVVIDVNGGLYT